MKQSSKLDPDTVHEIGVWALRIVLVGGAVFCAAHDKNDVAGALISAAIVSFFLL